VLQIVHQDIAQADLTWLWLARKARLHKEPGKCCGKPIGKSHDIFRLDFFGPGLGNLGLQLGTFAAQAQRRKHRRPAK
jgi:hypothetical protein